MNSFNNPQQSLKAFHLQSALHMLINAHNHPVMILLSPCGSKGNGSNEVKQFAWGQRELMTKPQAECLILCSTTHLPPAAVSSGAQSPNSVLNLHEHGTSTKKGVKNDILPSSPTGSCLCQACTCASLHAVSPMHRKQHRWIFRIKLLLQLRAWAQPQALRSCPPDLRAITSRIWQFNPPAKNPKLPLSNHCMDILARSVLITKQNQGSFPTLETNWDRLAVPLLQVSTPWVSQTLWPYPQRLCGAVPDLG